MNDHFFFAYFPSDSIKSLSNHRNPQVEYIMSNKLFFMTECKALRLPVPEFHVVENAHELKQLQRRGVFSNGERCAEATFEYGARAF